MRRSRAALAERLRLHLWAVPVVAAVLASALAVGLVQIDREIGQPVLGFDGGADSARGLLTTIATATLTVAGLVFSSLLIALQVASTQLSPRVMRAVLRDAYVRNALAVFVATFTYALVVLREVGDVDVPTLAVTVAVLFALASVAMLIVFIDHMAHTIRPSSVIERTRDELLGRIERTVREEEHTEPAWAEPGGPRVAHGGSGGVVGFVDIAGLVGWASSHDVAVTVVPRIGDFVPRGAPLFEVSGGAATTVADDDEAVDALHHLVRVDRERSPQQDIAFGFRELVDIVARALSTGINDPTTATQAIDALHEALRVLATRPDPPSVHCDDDGVARARVRRLSWEDMVRLAFEEPRLYGTTSVQVHRRLRAVLDDLLAVARPEHRPALAAERNRLDRAAERGFDDPDDRASAREPSQQG